MNNTWHAIAIYGHNRNIIVCKCLHYVTAIFIGIEGQVEVQFREGTLVGRFFECMIQSMKRCLMKTIGKARLTSDELTTVVVQVEGILNSRPILYVSSEDLEVLRNHHLFTGYHLLCLPDGSVAHDSDENFELTSHDLSARAQNQISFGTDDKMHILFSSERDTPTRRLPRYVPQAPIVGEAVLIYEESLKRT